MENPLTTGCGDWHLGWGYGGHDKIGKLTLDPLSNTFEWRGRSQGRHGRKWNYGANAVFTYSEGKIEILIQKGSIPVQSELIKGCEEILRGQMQVDSRGPKKGKSTPDGSKQLGLDL